MSTESKINYGPVILDSMHFTEAKGILSPNNGMNLYRGCSHGCIYCDSRSKCYRMEHDFEDIEVKSNSLELLEVSLRKKRKKCMIGTGSMTDPYIPLERELRKVRGSMELALKYGFGYTLITKSDIVLDDIDLLVKINEKTKCVVQMTLTTLNEELCKMIEPNVCTTRRRFEVLKELDTNGIPTVVWLCPLLPYINDTMENMKGILNYCRDAHVKGILYFGAGMTLREGNREYFYSKLDEHFPGMKERYVKEFGDSYSITSPNNMELSTAFHSFCESNGIMHDNGRIFAYLNELDDKKTVQTSLF